MKLKLAVVKYSNNYEEYKGLLSEQCDLYGIPCEMVAKLKRPVLVRVVNKEAGKNCIHYSTILNTDLTNERDEIGKAVSYAKYLTPDLLERLETLIERVNKDLTNPIETFSQLVNNGQIKDWIVARMRDAKIITDQNSTTYLQKYSGVLEFTDYGELIAKYMLLAIILEERKYIIAVKDKVLYILQTLPMWLKIKNLTHDYDIIPSVQNAILLEYRRRGEKTDINTFFDQTRMFEADNPIPLDEINKLCMKLMDVKSGKALRERLERYLEVATMSEEWLNGESLHEPDEIYSPTQALKYAINEKSRDTYKPTPPPKQEKHYQPKHVKGYYVPKSNLLDRNLTFFERIGKWVKDDLRGLH